MGIKVEVTHSGAWFSADGKEQEIPVGTELSFDGDEVPTFLANKCRMVNTTKGKKLEVADKQGK